MYLRYGNPEDWGGYGAKDIREIYKNRVKNLGESIGRAKDVILKYMNEVEYQLTDEDMEVGDVSYENNPKSNVENENILKVKEI